jgi:excisionase family DNA binding protein
MSRQTVVDGLSVDELKSIITDAMGEVLKSIAVPQKEQSKYLTREETGDLLRISLPTLGEYTKKGILKGYRIGGRVLYSKQEVVASLKQIVSFKHHRSINDGVTPKNGE